MTDGHVTRCPHCDTSFRVTDAQLAAARGAVRCGACLLVFTATDHFVAPAAEPEPPTVDEEPVDSSAVMSFGTLVGPEPADVEALEEEFEQELEEAIEQNADYIDANAQDESARPVADEVLPDEPDAPTVEDVAESEDFVIADDEVNIEEKAEPWRLDLRWAGASVLLVALLGLQFLWFERGQLSLNPQYREAYLSACRYLPCSLPEFAEPDELGISGLIIRSHPTRAGALRADALLTNDSRWRQGFPDLRLRFSNLSNSPVAARIFRPDEYLAGEMAGLKFIPGNTEVRVTIEIMDPGPDAVNYSLEIL